MSNGLIDQSRDYCLTDAFNFLGLRLFGPEWTGYEIWGRKAYDPTLNIVARGPLEDEIEQTTQLINAKQLELKQAFGKDQISQINMEIRDLKQERGELFSQLNKFPEIPESEIEDHGRWERFTHTEGLLLRTLQNGELTVFCPFGLSVPPRLWTELPDSFGWDWELSLIFWPPEESASRADTARISESAFEQWLIHVMPVNATLREEVPPLIRCRAFLKEEVHGGVKRMSRKKYMEKARAEIDGLSERQFLQAWTEIVPEPWKARGRRKAV